MAIVGLEPAVKDGQRFTQKEAAKLLGVSDTTVRTYEGMGIMPAGRRVGLYTFYYGRDIKRCWRNYFNQ